MNHTQFTTLYTSEKIHVHNKDNVLLHRTIFPINLEFKLLRDKGLFE